MKKNHLNVDPEDLNDVIKELEKNLNIKFADNELYGVKTFGDLCDAILSKINLSQKDDCTGQQAFYKLRNAIIENVTIENTNIKPETTLKELFPGITQINKIKNIENSLGFKLNILRVNRGIILTFFIGLVLALFIVFINLLYGLCFVLIILIFYFIISTTVKEFRVNTIGEVVEIMKQNNYFKSRRNQNTLNRKEIVKLVKKHLIDNLATDLKEINKDTIII